MYFIGLLREYMQTVVVLVMNAFDLKKASRSDTQPSTAQAATYISGTPTLGIYQPRALRAAATRTVPEHDSGGFS